MPVTWVIAVVKGDFLIDHLNHPDFVFMSPDEAVQRRAEALDILKKKHPHLTILDVRVVPAREMII